MFAGSFVGDVQAAVAALVARSLQEKGDLLSDASTIQYSGHSLDRSISSLRSAIAQMYSTADAAFAALEPVTEAGCRAERRLLQFSHAPGISRMEP